MPQTEKIAAQDTIIPRELWWAVAILIGLNDDAHTGTVEFSMKDGRVTSRRVVDFDAPPPTPGETVRIRMSDL